MGDAGDRTVLAVQRWGVVPLVGHRRRVATDTAGGPEGCSLHATGRAAVDRRGLELLGPAHSAASRNRQKQSCEIRPRARRLCRASADTNFPRWTPITAGDRPGNFFDEVPAGGDIHALQYILHDWDDDRCVRIPARLPAGQEHPDGRGGWHWTPSCPRVTPPIRARASTWSSWPRSPAGSEPGRSSPPCSTRQASG
ncbi:hypothetical protein FJK98_21445 [Micromonospora sp. HM134]|nr:hypothetical protein FJK98_21445 [Micromonospora sp. HM134]